MGWPSWSSIGNGLKRGLNVAAMIPGPQQAFLAPAAMGVNAVSAANNIRTGDWGGVGGDAMSMVGVNSTGKAGSIPGLGRIPKLGGITDAIKNNPGLAIGIGSSIAGALAPKGNDSSRARDALAGQMQRQGQEIYDIQNPLRQQLAQRIAQQMASGPPQQAQFNPFRPGTPENPIQAANGFYGQTNKPTTFQTSEYGQPEQVNITPMGPPNNGGMASQNFGGQAIASAGQTSGQVMGSSPANANQRFGNMGSGRLSSNARYGNPGQGLPNTTSMSRPNNMPMAMQPGGMTKEQVMGNGGSFSGINQNPPPYQPPPPPNGGGIAGGGKNPTPGPELVLPPPPPPLPPPNGVEIADGIDFGNPISPDLAAQIGFTGGGGPDQNNLQSLIGDSQIGGLGADKQIQRDQYEQGPTGLISTGGGTGQIGSPTAGSGGQGGALGTRDDNPYLQDNGQPWTAWTENDTYVDPNNPQGVEPSQGPGNSGSLSTSPPGVPGTLDPSLGSNLQNVANQGLNNTPDYDSLFSSLGNNAIGLINENNAARGAFGGSANRNQLSEGLGRLGLNIAQTQGNLRQQALQGGNMVNNSIYDQNQNIFNTNQNVNQQNWQRGQQQNQAAQNFINNTGQGQYGQAGGLYNQGAGPSQWEQMFSATGQLGGDIYNNRQRNKKQPQPQG